MITAAVAGASGYAGNELVRILSSHPEVRKIIASSIPNNDIIPADARKKISIYEPDQSIEALNSADIAFLAVPAELAIGMCEKISTKIVDLSPAHRQTKGFVYGLPEANRKLIKGAGKIANPGCYATACILGTLPILGLNPEFIAFDCKSGYSGGGKSAAYDYEDNVIPYGLASHYQEKEIGVFVKCPHTFVPHVVDSFRGILATIHIHAKGAENFSEKFQAFYKGEPFVKIADKAPDLSSSKETPYCKISVSMKNNNPDAAIVVSAIDNLLKGAASQAVQNMNLMLGFEETAGLVWPEK